MNIKKELVSYHGNSKFSNLVLTSKEFIKSNYFLEQSRNIIGKLEEECFEYVLSKDKVVLEIFYSTLTSLYTSISDANYKLAIDYYLMDSGALRQGIVNHISSGKRAEFWARLSSNLLTKMQKK